MKYILFFFHNDICTYKIIIKNQKKKRSGIGLERLGCQDVSVPFNRWITCANLAHAKEQIPVASTIAGTIAEVSVIRWVFLWPGSDGGGGRSAIWRSWWGTIWVSWDNDVGLLSALAWALRIFYSTPVYTTRICVRLHVPATTPAPALAPS